MCKKNILYTGPIRAAKAGKKSLVPARRAQRTNQGRTPLICMVLLESPFVSPISSLSDPTTSTFLSLLVAGWLVYKNTVVKYDTRSTLKRSHIQGADNKLGQFLSKDIYATANHRNCLPHSLESCLSLGWCNVNRPSQAKKYAGRAPNSLKVC